MSDPLTIAPPRPDLEQRRAARAEQGQADTRDAPGVFELVPRQWRVAEDDLATVQQNRLREKYAPVIDALRERGYAAELISDPLDLGQGRVLEGEGDYNRSTIWRLIQKEREAAKRAGKPEPFPELPQDRQSFEQPELTRFGERYVDQAEIARGSTGAQIASGIIGIGGLEMTRPINLATLPIGGVGKTALTRILTMGLFQGGIATAGLPEIVAGRQNLGEEFTVAEGAMYIGGAAVGGAAFQGLFEGGRVVLPPLFEKAIAANWDSLPQGLKDRWAARATIVDEAGAERLFTDLYPYAVPDHLRSPEVNAALAELRRLGEVEAANPFTRTYEGMDAHVARMEAALRALEEGRVAADSELSGAGSDAPVATPAARLVAQSGYDPEAVMVAIAGPESAGNDFATNRMGSSAAGRFQFIEDTFIGLYQRVYGTDRATAARVWNSKRKFDLGVQKTLMRQLLADNAAALQRAGLPTDPGNLYLAHFAGSGKAIELLRAPPEAPVSAFFSAKALKQNPTYLLNKDGTPKTVGEAISIIRSKVGDPAQRSPAPINPKLFEPELRDPALDADRPVVVLNDKPIGTSTFRASEIGVDAELMQFKSGGDQFGVTDRLRTVEQWDSYQAGFVTVWEAADGRRLIADGHQRLGLAKRIGARTGEDIPINAYVLREADGVTAAGARAITALKNVAEGSGTKTDAAKVFRELAPEEIDAALRRMAKGGEFIRDARGLARLEGEAFGAIVNEVVPENYGAAIGQLVEDPALHMGMVRVLAETQPANRRQAEAIIRQALDAGFVKETQDSLFGPEDLMTGLFAQRAKLLDRALSELKRLKGAFGVAVRNADTLEAGGNTIDVAGSAAQVEANALALALVDRLALRKGNAVNALLTSAAERIAAGESPRAVLRDFIAEIRKLDLAAIAREGDDAGGRGAGDGAGRGDGDVADEGGFLDGPGFFGRDEPTPAELDAAAAAKPRSDHTDLPPDPDPRFAEPDGPGIVAAADSAWHDIDAALKGADAADPNIAARQKQEAQLGADAPLRAPVDQDSEMGLGLFDAVDQKTLFDLGDGRGERMIGDIRKEIDGDRLAIEEIKKCLI